MRFSRQSLVLAGSALLLTSCVALQWLRMRNVQEGDRLAEARPVQLQERMPWNLAGWTGRDEPLGPNEVTRTAVERTLNYDDYVYRVFEQGNRQVAVYVAYWTAGRMPLQKVASHTPDRCWTENGWHCDAMRFRESVSAGDVSLLPAQWRLFTPPGSTTPTYVLYWHLVGSQLYDYGERFNARPDFVKWWRDTMRFALSGSEAQFFIRVTSNRPFDELAGEPAWVELVGTLGKLGLRQQPRAAN